MGENRNSFVNDGAARMTRGGVERVRTEVAVEFASQIAASHGVARVGMRFRRWLETRRRIRELGVGDSRHINWLRR